MATLKRLVLFVEGEGDEGAAPVLVKKLLTELAAWSHLTLDTKPFRVGNVASLTKDDCKKWLRFLRAAQKGTPLGGVLLLLDGDIDPVRKEPFCAAVFGRRLAEKARDAGAGKIFSAATVFACMEYESWLLACADRLAGLVLPDGRPGLRTGTPPPTGDIEKAPRDAKNWLADHIDDGYQQTRDQEPFTRLMVDHLDAVRARGLRSFQRLEQALRQLVEAVRTGAHVATPGPPPVS
jgi:hypothetical protein